jgi:diguanylate cyclase (GGDEF)-like protein/PAS domain S-box-containing protein
MILTEADLARYADLPNPCWVQDIYRSRVSWANDAAVAMLHAASRDELFARDISPRSEASRTRLWSYLSRVSDGSTLTTQWTTFASGIPVTFLAAVMGFRLANSRTTLFFSARVIDDSVCAEGLRMLEASRHSTAYFSLYSLSGELLEHNAAFTREFGERRVDAGDQFLRLFADPEEGRRVRAEIIGKSEFRGHVRVVTATTKRWHMMLALTILDPVDGQRVIHTELVDVSDQVEAEQRARDAEQLLQRIADEFAHPIAYILADKTYRFVNKTYYNWLALPRERILGRKIIDVAGEAVDQIWNQYWPTLAAGKRANYERHAVFPGRGERWISVDLIPHAVNGGTVDGAFVFGYDVHALKLAEANLKSSERQLARIADNLPVAVATVFPDYRIRFANLPFCRWFGARPETVVGRHAAEVVGNDLFEATHAERARAERGETVQFRRNANVEGKTRWADITLAPFHDEDGAIDGLVAVYQDVTQRVVTSEALNRVQNALTSHLANTPLGVMQLDRHRRVTQWTGRATDIFAWSEADAFGKSFDELALFDEEGRARFDQELHWLDQGANQRFTASFRNLRRDGSMMHGEWHGSVLRDAGGSVDSYLMLVQDVSARISAERHLQYVATHDLLTGFANRAQFQERLKTDIARARRLQQSLAVLFVDLDRFMYVNESLGHQAGDTLLQQVALRLGSAVLEGELIARTGADEFMMLVDLAADKGRSHTVAQAIRDLLAKAFQVANQEVYVTASIGVALFPDDADNDIDLIKNADWALYRAKDAGRNTIQFYSRSMAHDIPQRLSIEVELRHAIERSQLELHYQPKQNLVTRRITGAEALLRWRHPERGLIPPDQFIGLAEESGLIIELGRWVTQEACRQLDEWRTRLGVSTQIAINLSAVQLKGKELADEILAELARFRLPGSALMVEVTETSVVSDPLLASLSLETLRNNGVHAALDDFGKGFSSLAQLKRLPIDALKIDNSFVRDVIVDRESAAIVQAIIGLARNLEMYVVAEGVETAEQLAFLVKHGCDEAQGYLISRPLPAAEFAENFLRNL